MSRTLRLVFSKQEGIKQSWDYPSSREYCCRCAHRHCIDPIGANGTKSLKKSKGATHEKRYQKDLMFPDLDDDDDG